MKNTNYVGGADLLNAFRKYLSDEDVIELALSLKISNAIIRKRKELGLSQLDLANRLGVTQPVVSKWESGDTNFTIRTIVDLFSALNLEFEVLIGNEIQNYRISDAFTAGWKKQKKSCSGHILQYDEMSKLLAKGA